jgi:hypothetical protein
MKSGRRHLGVISNSRKATIPDVRITRVNKHAGNIMASTERLMKAALPCVVIIKSLNVVLEIIKHRDGWFTADLNKSALLPISRKAGRPAFLWLRRESRWP